MADIARLGFAADTSGLDKAVTSLQKLPPAAKAAETAAKGAADGLSAVSVAAQGVSTTTTNAGKAVLGAGASFNNANAHVTAYQKRLAMLNATYDDANSHVAAYQKRIAQLTTNYDDANAHVIAHAKATDAASKSVNGLSYQAKNLSFQLVDITQGVLSGISPMQIFAQQAGQVGQALASADKGQNLFKEIGQSILAFLTPMRLAIAGVVALGAGLLYLVTSALTSAKAMDDLSKSTDMSVKNLRALQQATAIKGITQDDFAQGMQSFAKSAFDAKQNLGDLNGLMIANNMRAKDSAQYFGNVADLVARTKSGIQQRNILEAAGLPTTQKWVDFMAQGSRGIDAVKAATVTFNEAAEKNLVQKAKDFDDAWNKATSNVSNYFKSVTMDGLSWFDKLTPYIDKVKKLTETRYDPPKGSATRAIMDQGNTFAERFGGDSKNPSANNTALATGLNAAADKLGGKPDPKTQQQLLAANQQAQARIGILGDLATVEQQVTLKQKELDAATLQGIGVSGDMEKKILNNTRALAEMNKVQQQASIGIFNESNARKAAADTLQSWIDKGLIDVNNAQQMAAAQNVLALSIKNTSDAAAVAASKYPQFTQAMLDAGNMSKQLDQTLTTSFNGLVSPIQDTINGVTSLKDGMANAKTVILKAIQEMIIKMLILKPLFSMFGGGGDLLGSIGSFFSGGGNPISGLTGSKSALGNVFDNGMTTKFANGGAFSNSIVSRPTLFSYANGSAFGEMGEAGPEAIMPLKRGSDGSLGVQMHGNGGGRGNVNVTYAPTYPTSGEVTQADLNRVQQQSARDRASFKTDVLQTIVDARKRGAKV